MNYTRGGCQCWIKREGKDVGETSQCAKCLADRDMYEALQSFNCNIDFVNDTNPNAKELLGVLTYDLRQALAKAGGK